MGRVQQVFSEFHSILALGRGHGPLLRTCSSHRAQWWGYSTSFTGQGWKYPPIRTVQLYLESKTLFYNPYLEQHVPPSINSSTFLAFSKLFNYQVLWEVIKRIPHAQKTSEDLGCLLWIPMIILLEVLLGNPCLFGLLGFLA